MKSSVSSIIRTAFFAGAFMALTSFCVNFSNTLNGQESANSEVPAANFVKLDNGDVRIFLDSEFFAEYRADYKGTPIIWPICAPNKSLVTRAWPMIDDVAVDDETDTMMKTIYQNAVVSERKGVKDHPHHRSFWFNHGDVNSGDFWGGTPANIRQARLISAKEDGKSVKLVTENYWNHDKLGRDVCRDVRTIVFCVLPELPNVRCIDFSVEVFALEDNVVFGDTKEGSFGIRVPSPMALTSRKISETWGGSILDDAGNKDGETWSKKAKWVNYVGPVERFLEGDELAAEFAKDSTAGDFPLTEAGIAVLNGPNSLNTLPWRHVRDYGLFASNPFGQKDFEPQNPDANGSRKLNKGESMSFSFRVLIHNGELTASDLDKAYADFNNR